MTSRRNAKKAAARHQDHDQEHDQGLAVVASQANDDTVEMLAAIDEALDEAEQPAGDVDAPLLSDEPLDLLAWMLCGDLHNDCVKAAVVAGVALDHGSLEHRPQIDRLLGRVDGYLAQRTVNAGKAAGARRAAS